MVLYTISPTLNNVIDLTHISKGNTYLTASKINLICKGLILTNVFLFRMIKPLTFLCPSYNLPFK